MKQMRLGEFISQAISEIIDGVAKAQEYAEGKGARINPRHVNWSDTKNSFYIVDKSIGADRSPLVTPIDFEVLVTTGEDDTAKGGIGILVAALGIGVQGEVKEYQEAVNKISFQILVKLPQQK